MEFLKYWPSFLDFNKLVIKAKMHAYTYFLKFSLLYGNTIWFIFYFLFLFLRNLAVCMKTKTFVLLFFNVLTKTMYFNTGFVSLQYKNTNQYWSKCSKKFMENHRFFWNNFWIFFLAGPKPAHVAGLDAASPAWSLAQASDPKQAMHA